MAKFTFKTEKSTGRYRSFYPDNYYVRLNKEDVGLITDDKPHKVKLKVVDGDKFRWIVFKREFDTVSEARDWIRDNCDSILERHSIYMPK